MRPAEVVLSSLVFVSSSIFAQSGERDLDESTTAERAAFEAYLERALSEPMDLQTASVEDLLVIPGLRRREAERIITAVRSGLIRDLRSVDLLPGVRSGTASRLDPYVVLSSGGTRSEWSTRFRSRLKWSDNRGRSLSGREVHHLRLESNGTSHGRSTTLAEVRYTGSPAHEWFTFVRAPTMDGQLQWHIGSMDIRNGSALLDHGRRVSILRSSEWERRLNADARIFPGYDNGTSFRGFGLSGRFEARSFMSTVVEAGHGARRATLAWSEHWDDAWFSHVVLDGGPVQGAIRVEYSNAPHSISLESSSAGGECSWVVSFRRSAGRQPEVQWIARQLRSVSAAGVPRLGGLTSDEDAVGMSLAWANTPGWEWRLVGDVGRESTARPENGVRWNQRTAVGIGGDAKLDRAIQLGWEWTSVTRSTGGAMRWNVDLRHRFTRNVMLSAGVSKRTERDASGGVSRGRMGSTTVTLSGATFTTHVRWTGVDGERSVEFWTLGPGPSSLSGFQRLSGPHRQIRGVIQWHPTADMELSAAGIWRLIPERELEVCIRLEIHVSSRHGPPP